MLSSPEVFKVVNVDNDPVKRVDLEWSQVKLGDAVMTNQTPLNSPEYVLNGTLTHIGWRIYRGPIDFTPGEGNCIVDENTLGRGALSWSDVNVPAYGTYAYAIAAVYEE